MKNRIWLLVAALTLLLAKPAAAENRFIVRTSGGLQSIQGICAITGCKVSGGLDGSLGQLFLVTTPDLINPNAFLATLLSQPAVVDAELDQLVHVMQASASAPPSGLWDSSPVSYYGTTAWDGYVNQPAAQIIGIQNTQNTFSVAGAGIVAVIDTGVDPHHPVLVRVLVPGYDFIRNQQGGSEMADLTQPPTASNGQRSPAQVNQSTVAVLDQSTVAVLDNTQYAAFGHGTMVAGIIHLVAPQALIMPLKAFRSDGTGYSSDILRAIYYATQHDANVINMSFSLMAYSQELSRAINSANRAGIICVASAGNHGKDELAYPAAFSTVMGVASTTNDDQRASFSNFGQDIVWVAAPGEAIITTYPFATYAAGWGTSFSAPLVSGAAALLKNVQADCNQYQAAQAVAHAKPISPDLGNGRLDLQQALAAWRSAVGME